MRVAGSIAPWQGPRPPPIRTVLGKPMAGIRSVARGGFRPVTRARGHQAPGHRLSGSPAGQRRDSLSGDGWRNVPADTSCIGDGNPRATPRWGSGCSKLWAAERGSLPPCSPPNRRWQDSTGTHDRSCSPLRRVCAAGSSATRRPLPRDEAQQHGPLVVVWVGVEQCDRLPHSQRQLPIVDGHRQGR